MKEINPDRLLHALERNDSIMDIAKWLNREPATVLQAIMDNSFVKRKCMGCGSTFISDGPGNRFCSWCKKQDVWHGVDENFLVL